MRGGPTPAYGAPPDPVAGWLFRVSYTTPRGFTFSKLYRQQSAAEQFALKVPDNGGDARVHRTRVGPWEELPACHTCAANVPHGHPW